jgi:hypothetical protein
MDEELRRRQPLIPQVDLRQPGDPESHRQLLPWYISWLKTRWSTEPRVWIQDGTGGRLEEARSLV